MAYEVCMKDIDIYDMAVSNDGETVIVAGTSLVVASLMTGERMHSYKEGNGYCSVSVSRTLVVTATDNGLFVFRQDATTKALYQIQHIVDVGKNCCVAFNSTGSVLISASWLGTVRLWDVNAATGALTASARVPTLPLHVNVVAWSPTNEHVFACVCYDGVRVFDARAEGQAGATIGPVGAVGRDGNIALCMAFDPSDGATIAVGYDGKVARWDARAPHAAIGAQIIIKAHVYCIQYSPCGRVLAIGGYDDMTQLLDATGPELVPLMDDAVLRGHTDGVKSLQFHPYDPTVLVSCCSDGTVRRWSVPECALGLPFEGPSPPDTPPSRKPNTDAAAAQRFGF